MLKLCDMSKQKLNKITGTRAFQYFKVSGLGFLALIYFRFGFGAVELKYWVLAITSVVATVALIMGGVKVSHKQPTSLIIFIGTFSVFIAHIPITLFGNDESPIFLIALAIIPTTLVISSITKK